MSDGRKEGRKEEVMSENMREEEGRGQRWKGQTCVCVTEVCLFRFRCVCALRVCACAFVVHVHDMLQQRVLVWWRAHNCCCVFRPTQRVFVLTCWLRVCVAASKDLLHLCGAQTNEVVVFPLSVAASYFSVISLLFVSSESHPAVEFSAVQPGQACGMRLTVI